ncbi:DUF4190 domain-containing protein [Amycolatopsis pigmentata]|uniref:DUF4190 domain-containing protein n=1 Tax=Amycolatopsis pigmentata TaxID=450801 RepID=A0ABW5FWN4_9PSEU
MSEFPMPPAPVTTAPAQRKNGLGTAGFVLGLIGVIFAFIPLIGVVAWPLTILGLIFGIVGTLRANKGQADNKGLAISGLVLSVVGLIICVIWTAAFGKAVNDVANTMPTPVAPPVIKDSAAPGAPANAAPAAPGAAKHTVLLEVTTGSKSNVEWHSGLTVNSQDVIDGGKTWSQTLSMNDLAFSSVSVTPVSYQMGTANSTCKITVDGKKVSENSNALAALCTYMP